MSRIGYFRTSLFFSVIFHLLLIFLAFSVTLEPKCYISFSPVYRVNLVELPKPKPKAKPKSKQKMVKKGASKAKKTRKVAKVRTTSKKVAKKKKAKIKLLRTKVKTKTIAKKVVSLKKAKVKAKKVRREDIEPAIVEKKIKEIAKKVEEKIKKEELKQEVAQLAEEIKKGASGGVIGEYVNHKPTGTEISPEFQMYYMDVWEKIKAKWVLPTFMLKRKQVLEAIVVIKIDRQGKIVKKTFEKHSGNPLFDQSVSEAIDKASPLPPLPPDYTQPYHEIGIRFRWAGTRKEVG